MAIESRSRSSPAAGRTGRTQSPKQRAQSTTASGICSAGHSGRRSQPLNRVLLHIIARGKIGRSPEAELVGRYLKRIVWPTRLTELPERGGRKIEPSPGVVAVVLDERGKAL